MTAAMQIAAEHIGRLRQRALRLAEYQHGRGAERRDQQRNSGHDRQRTDGEHADARRRYRISGDHASGPLARGDE